MRNLWRAVLRLYPAEYQSAFAAEMTEAFEEARIDMRRRGLPKRMFFAAREFAGLMKGLVLEHAAKWTTQNAYISSRCAPRCDTGLPAEIVEVQVHLEHLLRSMEFAIAHHDFPKARFYSNEERTTRALLQRLVKEYKLDNTPVLET